MSVDHSGHRQRLKSALKENGLQSFSPHEVVELMLYDALPRRDVNELAHRICDEMGGMQGLLNAEKKDLTEKCGLSEHTADTLIAYMNGVKCYRESASGEKFIRTRSDLDAFRREIEKTEKDTVALLSPEREVVLMCPLPKEDRIGFLCARMLMYDAPEALIFLSEKSNPEQEKQMREKLELIGGRPEFIYRGEE